MTERIRSLLRTSQTNCQISAGSTRFKQGSESEKFHDGMTPSLQRLNRLWASAVNPFLLQGHDDRGWSVARRATLPACHQHA